MSWTENPLLAFDLETTGVDVENDRIVSAALVTVHPDSCHCFTTEWLINPGVPIPEEASNVHGITDEVAAEGHDPAVAIAAIVAELAKAIRAGTPIVTMNGSFDLTLLDREARRHNTFTLGELLTLHAGPMGAGVVGPVIDVRVLDKHLDKFRSGKRKLTDLCRHYGVTLDNAHTATADAEAAAHLAIAIGERYKYPLMRMSAAQLHTSQIAWHEEQVLSFAAYRERTGNPLPDVNTQWPIRELAAV